MKGVELQPVPVSLPEAFEVHDLVLDGPDSLTKWLDHARLGHAPETTWIVVVNEGWDSMVLLKYTLNAETAATFPTFGGLTRVMQSIFAVPFIPGIQGRVGCLGFIESASKLVSVDESITYDRAAVVTTDTAALGVWKQPHWGFAWSPASRHSSLEIGFMHDLITHQS